MPHLFTAARVITPDTEFAPGWVLEDSGRIEATGPAEVAPDVAETTDLGDVTLVPGFVDIHVHGGGGFSLMTADPDEVRAYARWAVAHGVTAILPTVVADDTTQGLEFVRAVAEATGPVEAGATVLGINLEGPFVSEQYPGALPKSWLKEPEVALLDLFAETGQGHLKLITIAAEMTRALVSRAVELGIRVSVGHSGADYQLAEAAFLTGASHVTHLFNAMRPFHHRDPGILGAAFDAPGVTVEVIADGVHLDPTTVAMATRLFGPERIALVSDAVAPAGLSAGTFRLGDEEARLEGDKILLPDGTIAGGAATMDSIVRHIVTWQAGTLSNAVTMAGTVPAAVAGAGDRKGRLGPGYDADFVALTPELAVAATWVGGRMVYSSGALAA